MGTPNGPVLGVPPPAPPPPAAPQLICFTMCISTQSFPVGPVPPPPPLPLLPLACGSTQPLTPSPDGCLHPPAGWAARPDSSQRPPDSSLGPTSSRFHPC